MRTRFGGTGVGAVREPLPRRVRMPVESERFRELEEVLVAGLREYREREAKGEQRG